MWIELPLIFLGGLLGSTHCLGMCGGFAVAVGSQASSWPANLARQVVYTLGRVFTYATLGAFAGFGGNQMAIRNSTMVNIAAVMSVVAGVFLLYQGLVSARVITPITTLWRTWTTKSRGEAALASVPSPCAAAGIFATFLRAPGWKNVFLAGLFTGMLPCGLVYGFLALATSTTNMFYGAALMAVFGTGTAPLMIVAGTGASALSLASRSLAFRLAAWCVVLTGAISVMRGLGFLSLLGGEVAGCPMCE